MDKRHSTFKGLTPRGSIRLDYLFLSITMLLGSLQVYACRYELGPDGMDYLDIARGISTGQWGEIANGYWGTLYCLLLSPIMHIGMRPNSELMVVHCCNLLVLLFSFTCFRFLLHSSLQEYCRHSSETCLASYGSLAVLGYGLFIWSSLILISPVSVGPDLLVSAFIYLAAAYFVKLSPIAPLSLFLLFGLSLGVGYYAKAIMFPISILFLSAMLLKVRDWKKCLVAIVMFVMISGPLILALSIPRHRFTFGDSGKLNYSSFVSPGGRALNWQGVPKESGVPVHPTRKIEGIPPIYEFDGPINATYPPSFDPSYWNEGRVAIFSLRAQLRIIAAHLPMVLQMLFVVQPSIVACFIFLLLFEGQRNLRRVFTPNLLMLVALATIFLYVLVHFETRFVGACVVILWFFAFLRLLGNPDESSRHVADLSILALVISVVLVVTSMIAKTFRKCPDSALMQIDVARELRLSPNTKVGVIGSGNYSFWAYFAHARIVAEIPDPDEASFWTLPVKGQEERLEAFHSAGAEVVIAVPPSLVVSNLQMGWQRIGSTPYYRFRP